MAKSRPNIPTKLDILTTKLRRPKGASLDDLVKATGWQPHSVRGALAGALKKKGLDVTSLKVDGTRRYHVAKNGNA